MAKRVAQKIKRVQAANLSRSTSTSSRGGFKLPKSLSTIIAAPATMYVAGGIGLAVLARFAYKYYNSHPEISDYISENFENVEGKLKQYRDNLVGSADLDDATH